MSKAIELSFPVNDWDTVNTRLSLAQLLYRLVDRLANVSDGKESVEQTGPALAQWTDADYIYLEADLGRPHPGLEADVSIQSGRTFVRIARRAAELAATNRGDHGA